MERFEFHIHTRYSKDSILNYYFIMLMCKLKRIKCIAITDHNEVKGALNYKKKLEKHHIKVIVGEEVFTNQGEIIGLFLSKKIEPNLTPKETINEIKKQNGLVYIPHPYDEKRYKSVLKEKYIEEFRDEIDFIEIHNGRNFKKEFSDKQEEVSNKYNITPIIGSDAHIFWELGRNYLLMDMKVDKEQLVENVKNAVFHKSDCIRISHQVTKIVKTLKMIFRGECDELFRIVNRKCKRRK